jgi:hypothetical protein
MKIVLLGSKNGREKIPKVFDSIIKTLEDLSIEILGPYTQSYEEVLSHEEMKISNPNVRHALFMRKVIRQADALIVETTFDGFALGHESTVALEEYKPVLAISQSSKDFSFIHDTKFRYNSYKKHTDIPPIIKDFIEYYNQNFKVFRLNILLHQRQVNYLRWIYQKRNINRSLFIRSLIDKAIDKDSDYPN